MRECGGWKIVVASLKLLLAVFEKLCDVVVRASCSQLLAALVFNDDGSKGENWAWVCVR